MSYQALFEHHAALGSHIKQQINNAEIWQKARTLLKHLIIRLHSKLRVVLNRHFGRNQIAQVGSTGWHLCHIVTAHFNAWRERQERQHNVVERGIEVG